MKLCFASCVCVCVIKLKISDITLVISLARMFQNVLECSSWSSSWKSLTDISRKSWQNVPECSRTLKLKLKISDRHYIKSKVVPEGSRRFQNVLEGSRRFQNAHRSMGLHADFRSMSLHADCRSMSLLAGPWACMELHKLTWNYITCMQVHELTWSLYAIAVPFFVWAAHKNFEVLVESSGPIEQDLIVCLIKSVFWRNCQATGTRPGLGLGTGIGDWGYGMGTED